jgi:lysophospholipase L1-like esterase
VASVRDGSNPVRGFGAGDGQRRMARQNPDLARSGRQMAHLVRPVKPDHRNPLAALSAAIGAALPHENDPGIWGRIGGLRLRLVPHAQRRRELTAVLALILAVTAISASLPGGWAQAGPVGSSESGNLVAEATSAGRTADLTNLMLPVGTTAARTAPPLPRLSPTLPPSPKPTAKPTKTPAPIKVYTFVAMGDSLTAWPSDNPWPSRLDGVDARLRMVNNAGVPGDTTAQMRGRFSSDVLAYNPNVVLIMGGTNDLGTGVSPNTTIANLKAMIIAAKAKKIRVFLLLIPPDSMLSMASKIDSLNAQIQRLGNLYGVIVIDTHKPLSTTTGIFVRKYTSDGLHFSAAGAAVVASTVHDRVRRAGY